VVLYFIFKKKVNVILFAYIRAFALPLWCVNEFLKFDQAMNRLYSIFKNKTS
jgi:hypothetical protein